ncbi:MAG: hypothetical protein U0X91_01230 [Spirosomataceae bacterium]
MALNDKFDLQRFHFEHTLWLNEVSFIAQEVAIFGRLLKTMEAFLPTEEAEENFQETLHRFEHQLTQFKRTTESIQAEIQEQEAVMAKALQEKTAVFNEDIRETQAYLREKMKFFHDNYRKLKNEFKLFVGKDLESHFEITPKIDMAD